MADTITVDLFDNTDVIFTEVVTEESLKAGYREFRDLGQNPQTPRMIRQSHKLLTPGSPGVDRHRVYVSRTKQDAILGTFHTMSATMELVAPRAGGFTSVDSRDLMRHLFNVCVGATNAGTNALTILAGGTPTGDFSD